MNGYREDETYNIIGICMEVHRTLGPGLLEIIYKDALEIEFKENNIPFEREKEFAIEYKGKILPHKFYADFIVNEDINSGSKSCKRIHE
ncbi:GxxExxY protein [Flavobacterium aquicola]|uniref:GxxExxY protein n=1 Tax=Flavobacterium aquicola TaxID=1682742 RepID=A0A3E0EQF7_9FLAO|nr:GxxExxY protein [Flavobacterium aquicola]REH00453.1 GxxExxY protein [Flavobacterium aquicola]